MDRQIKSGVRARAWAVAHPPAVVLCGETPPGVEPELLLDDLAPPGVEPECSLYRFVVGGVPAFSGKAAPKSKEAATW